VLTYRTGSSAAAGVALTLSSCGVVQSTCIPGEPVNCRCPNNTISQAVCEGDGTIGVCHCDVDSDGTNGGTGGGGDSSTGGTALGGSGAESATLPPIEDPSACSTVPIDVEVVDAEYSAVLDVIAILAGSPDSVVILDSGEQELSTLDLPLPGIAISVAPDQPLAAIGHDGYVSIVDLESGTLTDTIPITATPFDVAFGYGGLVYVLPSGDTFMDVRVVDVAQGAQAPFVEDETTYSNMFIKAHPDGRHLYAVTTDISPGPPSRLDLDGAEVSPQMRSYGDGYACGDLWITSDGGRMVTACGTAFRAAPEKDQDMEYVGTLEGTSMEAPWWPSPRYRSLAEDTQGGRIFGVPQSHPYDPERPPSVEVSLDVYGLEYLEYLRSVPIPCMRQDSSASWMLGRFAFVSASGESVYVLSQSEDSSFSPGWGLSILPTD
jgi:chitinase